MEIACLGWGSLVWEPKDLRVGEWRSDGPSLPLEFARHSGGDRLTLVLDQAFGPVTSLWATIEADDLESARRQLAEREGMTSYSKHPNWIGSWPQDGLQDEVTGTVGTWAQENRLDGVVWTALPPKFRGKNGTIPTQEEAIRFLREQGSKSEAAKYVRNAPEQIVTPYRRALESELDWLRHTA